jgi:hypothetical protein
MTPLPLGRDRPRTGVLRNADGSEARASDATRRGTLSISALH